MRSQWKTRLGGALVAASLLSTATGGWADQPGAEKLKQPVSARIETVHTSEANPPIGNVIVKYADGQEDAWTLKGNCSTPKVSPQGVVGWIVYSLKPDGKTLEMYRELAVNGKLTLCEKGKVLTTISSEKAFIENWGFAADGRHFVVKSRGAHGPATIQLFGFKGGAAESSLPAYGDKLPEWARPYRDD